MNGKITISNKTQELIMKFFIKYSIPNILNEKPMNN